MSLGAGLGRLKGKVFRIGHLGDFNDLMLAGTLSGVEMGLAAAGVPFNRGGVTAALEYLAGNRLNVMPAFFTRLARCVLCHRHLSAERHRARAPDPRERAVGARSPWRPSRPDRARQSGRQRHRHAGSRSGPGTARGWPTKNRQRPADRPAARSADRAQGSAADQGHPDDIRLADLHGLRADRGLAARRAAAPAPARSSSARPTRRSSAPARRPSTPSSARR